MQNETRENLQITRDFGMGDLLKFQRSQLKRPTTTRVVAYSIPKKTSSSGIPTSQATHMETFPTREISLVPCI
jgi:hypothetical protein